MKNLPVRLGLCAVTAIIFVGAVLWSTQWDAGALSGQTPEGARTTPVAMPTELAGVLITLGLKDKAGTDWDGDVAVSAGKVLAVDIVEGNPKASVAGNKFNVRSVATPKKAAKKKKKGGGHYPAHGARHLQRAADREGHGHHQARRL